MAQKDEKPKGIYYGEDTEVRYISVAHAEVYDMLCESDIGGLVHEEYLYPSGRSEGDLGWGSTSAVTVNEFINSSNSNILPGSNNVQHGQMCSIYWNEVPIIDKTSGKLNFTDIDIELNQTLFNTQGFKNKRIKAVGEVIKGSEENQTSHYKYYKIYNKECSKIRMAIKLGALGKVDRYRGTPQEPNEGYGQLLDTDLLVDFYYRPMYSGKEVSVYTLAKRTKFQGNLSTPYIRDIELILPLSAVRGEAESDDSYGDFLGWEIQIIRQTAEPKTQDVKMSTVLDTIQEEVNHTFTAPNSYIVKSKFNAEYFGQVPERAFDVKLLKVKIPDNYDPINRHYTGNWEGGFKSEKVWTDNPAWCFYDLMTNKRYGLGKYIEQVKIDKWTLYKIAQYCDTLVTSADGGLEPRFTCNVLIQTREDAFKVLTDMASIFRAMIYYSTGTVYAVQDSKKDSVFQFTNSDVENGDFTYSSTSRKVRHTVAIVRYNDKDNFYKPAVEYVDDIEGIRRYGIKEKEITAFGCSSRGQAIRMGKWILSTERLETETASFVTGSQGSMLRPGDVFTVSDSNRLMKRRGGRILDFTRVSNSQFTILLDSKLAPLDSAGDGEDGNDKGRNYELTLSAPSFFYDPAQTDIEDSSQIQFIRNHHVQKFTITNEDIDYDSGTTGKSLVTVNCSNCLNSAGTQINLSDVIDKMSWSILTNSVDADVNIDIQEQINQSKRFRVINVVEKEINQYEISAAEYSEAKYDEIDKRLNYTNALSFQQPLTPAGLQIDNPNRRLTPNTAAIDYSVLPNTTSTRGLSHYAVYISQGTGTNNSNNPFDSNIPSDELLTDKIYSIASNASSGSFIPSTQTHYFFRVYAVNSLGQYSSSYVENSVAPGGAQGLGPVDPIKDVTITNLRLNDDTEVSGNDPGESDPVAGTNKGGYIVDEFDGSDIRINWKTELPEELGQNTSFEFSYRIRIYKGYPETGTLLFTNNDFKPVDWNLGFTSFELPEADLINLTKVENGNAVNLDDVYRSLSFVVDARDYSSTPRYSSDGNTQGEDILYVENPRPTKADSEAPLQGFIDINAHIKVFNTRRASDAKSVYIIAAKRPFTYEDYVWSTESTNSYTGLKRSDYKFNTLRINPIDSSDPVFEVDPSFKTDDMDLAYVAIAYTDDFDENLITYKTLNGSTWDIDKKFARYNAVTASTTYPYGKQLVAGSSRVSDVLEVKKVTPEVIDLIGEGWKAWIKVDINGEWQGTNIECIRDITDDFDDYKGYVPFYCGRKIPWVRYAMLFDTPYDSSNFSQVNVQIEPSPMDDGSGGFWGVGGQVEDLFTASCLYFLPNQSDANRPRGDYTNNTFLIGGYKDNSADSNNWYTTDTNHPYYERTDLGGGNYEYYKFTKGFKRYMVYFKPNKGFDPDHYWVMGMNANEKAYFHNSMLAGLGRFATISDNETVDDYESNLVGGAGDALIASGGTDTPWANNASDDEVYIGGSDAYFNYHPAGFVQGFGGLDKKADYFDIHLGHMIDGSYLKDAIFFVMATNQDEKQARTDCNG